MAAPARAWLSVDHARNGCRPAIRAFAYTSDRRSGELPALDNSVRSVSADAAARGHARRIPQSGAALVDRNVFVRGGAAVAQPTEPFAAAAQLDVVGRRFSKECSAAG